VRRPGLLIAAIVLVGLAGTVVALVSRNGDTVLVAQQQDLVPVSTVALEQLIATTSDPRPLSDHGRALSARCTSRATGELRNPWTCLVRYPRPPAVRYTVIVHSDRSFRGTSAYYVDGRRGGSLVVHGCCVSSGAP